LSRAVYATIVTAARELLDAGTSTYAAGGLTKAELEAALAGS